MGLEPESDDGREHPWDRPIGEPRDWPLGEPGRHGRAQSRCRNPRVRSSVGSNSGLAGSDQSAGVTSDRGRGCRLVDRDRNRCNGADDGADSQQSGDQAAVQRVSVHVEPFIRCAPPGFGRAGPAGPAGLSAPGAWSAADKFRRVDSRVSVSLQPSSSKAACCSRRNEGRSRGSITQTTRYTAVGVVRRAHSRPLGGSW